MEMREMQMNLKYYANIGVGDFFNEPPKHVMKAFEDMVPLLKGKFENYLVTNNGVPGIAMETKYGVNVEENLPGEFYVRIAEAIKTELDTWLKRRNLIKYCETYITDNWDENPGYDIDIGVFVPYFLKCDLSEIEKAFYDIDNKVYKGITENNIWLISYGDGDVYYWAFDSYEDAYAKMMGDFDRCFDGSFDDIKFDERSLELTQMESVYIWKIVGGEGK